MSDGDIPVPAAGPSPMLAAVPPAALAAGHGRHLEIALETALVAAPAASAPPESVRPEHAPSQCRRIAPVLQRVGDKWTILVVVVLGEGPLRFNELKRRVGGISQRMLTLTVRGLERDGFVDRTMTPTIPPAVSYALTPMGRSLLDPVRALGAWALAHLPAIEAARARFDAHGPSTGWETRADAAE